MTLDEARLALFVASREMQKAHSERLRRAKSDAAAVECCRAADRALQVAAVRYTAVLCSERERKGISYAVNDLAAELEIEFSKEQA